MDFNVDDDETVERLWLVVRSVRPKQETDVSCQSTLQNLVNIYHALQFFPCSYYLMNSNAKFKTFNEFHQVQIKPDYKLRRFDVIKLGRVRFRVKDIIWGEGYPDQEGLAQAQIIEMREATLIQTAS